MVIEFFHDDLHTALSEGEKSEVKWRTQTSNNKISGTPSTKRVPHWITVIIQFIIIQSVIMARYCELMVMRWPATNNEPRIYRAPAPENPPAISQVFPLAMA